MLTMDLDTLFAAADPARQDPDSGPDSAGAARLYREIITDSRPSRRRPGWSRFGVPLAAGAAATAAIVTAVVLTVPGSGGPPSPATPAGAPGPAASRPASLVADVLNTAARSAAGQAGRLPGPGQYFYIKQIDVKHGGPGGTACATIVYEFWISRDGAGRERGTSPGCHIPQNTFDLPLPKQVGLSMGYLDWPGLPTQPAALKQAIASRLGDPASNPSDMFLDAGMALNADAPPALRAALFRMMETLPGITDLGPMRDPLGRPGIGIGLIQHPLPSRWVRRGKLRVRISGYRESLMMIISPRTGAVLAEAVGLTRSLHGPGPRMNPSTNVTAGIVNSITSTHVASRLLPPAQRRQPART
jgi:hypothetical protein